VSATDTAPYFVRFGHTVMIRQTICVTKVHVDSDPQTHVFQVEIYDGVGSCWSEVFNTEERLNTFLHGLRVAIATFGATFLTDQAVQFAPESCVKSLDG